MRLGLGHGLDVGYRSELFGATSYLLDTYTGAAAAYSLRQLRTGVTSVVRVRRSSDDAEADFTAAEVSDGTLTTWTGANDGFVVTWYDQSGNTGRDATQATAAAQPKIVNAGALITDGGLPAISCDGTDDVIGFTFATALTQPITIFNAHNFTSGARITGTVGAGTDRILIYDNASGRTFFAGGLLRDLAYRPTGRILETAIFNTTNSAAYSNGALAFPAGDAGSNTMKYLYLGADSTGTAAAVIKYHEIILYASDQSANRADIEAAINSHYSIY